MRRLSTLIFVRIVKEYHGLLPPQRLRYSLFIRDPFKVFNLKVAGAIRTETHHTCIVAISLQVCSELFYNLEIDFREKHKSNLLVLFGHSISCQRLDEEKCNECAEDGKT
jgi:hypothetical protein